MKYNKKIVNIIIIIIFVSVTFHLIHPSQKSVYINDKITKTEVDLRTQSNNQNTLNTSNIILNEDADYSKSPDTSLQTNKREVNRIDISNVTREYPLTQDIRLLDLSNINRNILSVLDISQYENLAFAFRWGSGVFKWGLGNDENTIPNLSEIEISDDLENNSDYLISNLLSFENNTYLFIEPINDLSNLEIHIYLGEYNKTNEISGDNLRILASNSNYNSGAKYSSFNIIPRETWSGDPNINDPRVRDAGGRLVWEPYYYNVQKIIIHHTATPNNQDPIYWMKTIYNFHSISNNWGDIGYNYLIDQYGNIYEGKLGGDEAKGYHAGSANANSIGISLIGDFTSTLPTQAAQDSLVRLIAEKASLFDFTPNYLSTVYGHRDVVATGCPGNAFYPLLSNIANSARSYKDNNFSEIKNVVSMVNNGIDNGDYKNYELILLLDSNASISTIANLFPVYNNQLIVWNGIDKYIIDGKMITLYIHYGYAPYESQTSKDRLRTLYKIFLLRDDVKAVGLNFIYYTN